MSSPLGTCGFVTNIHPSECASELCWELYMHINAIFHIHNKETPNIVEVSELFIGE